MEVYYVCYDAVFLDTGETDARVWSFNVLAEDVKEADAKGRSCLSEIEFEKNEKPGSFILVEARPLNITIDKA